MAARKKAEAPAEFTDIELSRPMKFDGAEVSAIRMREPTVRDQLAAEKFKGGDAEREVQLLANLCDLSPDDIQSLGMRDYGKLQKAYTDFLA